MISQLLRELLSVANGKPRRLVAVLAAYAIAATFPESSVAHEWAIEHYGMIRVAGVVGLLYWVVSELIAQYNTSRHRAVPYHEFEQFRKDQMLANEEAADLLVRLHGILSADDDTTLADKVATLEAHSHVIDQRQLRMLDVISTPYYETDTAGRLTLVNEAFSELYNTTPRNMLRVGATPFIHKDDVDKVTERYRAAIAVEGGYTVEFRVVIRGKVLRCVRVVGYPMWLHGKFSGHYGYVEVINCDSN